MNYLTNLFSSNKLLLSLIILSSISKQALSLDSDPSCLVQEFPKNSFIIPILPILYENTFKGTWEAQDKLSSFSNLKGNFSIKFLSNSKKDETILLINLDDGIYSDNCILIEYSIDSTEFSANIDKSQLLPLTKAMKSGFYTKTAV